MLAERLRSRLDAFDGTSAPASMVAADRN
jgi:hypothetical protein